MSSFFSGGCLCGAIRYQCTSEPVFTLHCQCSECRKTSATGHSSKLAIPKSAVTISGELKFYESQSESKHTVRRGFCSNCGSPVYSESSGFLEIGVIAASSLDDPSVFKPSIVIYAANAPSWDFIDPQLPKFPGMPQLQ